MNKILHSNVNRLQSCLNRSSFAKIKNIFWIFLFILLLKVNAMASEKEYHIERKPDGGYTIDLRINKRHWKPITAEGFFPKQELYFKIDIDGKGKDWSSKDQPGYYYSSDFVSCKGKAWDFGYAWIDHDRKFLYLTFYWASSPDKLIASDVNGKYSLPKE
jgi:hypothetical protein